MDLAGYVAVLRRRLIPIVLCVVAGLAGGIYLGTAPAKDYRATAKVFVSLPPGGTAAENLAATQNLSAYVATYAKIATSTAVAQVVVDTLHLSESARTLQDSLSASPETGTFIIDISATDHDPGQAAAIANEAADALHGVVSTLRSTGSDDITVATIDKASTPGSPFTPRPKLDAALGLVLGLVVGLALAAALEALDRTVKTSEQAVEVAGAPALGLIPRRRGGMGVAGRDVAHDQVTEAFRSLRTSVRFLDPDRPLRTILVTSASPADGKTTTAANLAISLARGGERVIVVDCDLRRSSLGPIFGLEAAVGVTSILRRQVTLDEALQEWTQNLYVLPSGPLPPNPAEILGSQAMAGLLEELSAEADVVILDAPPVVPVTDAVVLSTQVDGVVLVVRHGRTLRTSAAEATRRLAAVGVDVAGVVLNAVPASAARGYYVDYPSRTPTEV